MTQSLSSNPAHLQTLCGQLKIGVPTRDLSRVHGGFHHTMWRLETDRGSYAIKQLSADTDLDDPDTRNHYNASEAIAATFAGHGIPAVFALTHNQGHLQIIGTEGYLVYPWHDAVTLQLSEISASQALQVAAIFAKMHRADIEFPGLRDSGFDAHSRQNIIDLIEIAWDFHAGLADALQRELPTFLAVIDAQQTASALLTRHQVISHGDLDQKNVLWDDQGRPLLIDWESAGTINPTYEMLREALNWSGIGARFDRRLFGKILAAYERAGGVIDRKAIAASYDCILGDWVNWLMYNLGRTFSFEHTEQRELGATQIGFALSTMQRIMDQVPGLLTLEGR